ncbi:MAG: uroporphyrinogen-III synthase [Bacteroidota bacterium]
MARNVFISREVDAQSIFLQKVLAAGARVHGESLLQFTLLPFDNLPIVDWIFFYSKTAVRFFFQTLADRPLPSCRYAAIGPRTAAVLSAHVSAVDFVGNGQPSTTAMRFVACAKGERVLFPRARQSRQSVQKQLQQDIEVVDLVIYDNQIRQDIALPRADILVFTSPLNAKAYFQYRPYATGQQLVAIGTTTADALRQLGMSDVHVAATPSELGLADAVLKLLSTDL